MLRQVIEGYGWNPTAGERVTVACVSSDVAQRKAVERYLVELLNHSGLWSDVWYDLNTDGVASDLTATFDILRIGGGLRLRLIDIHVM